MLCWLVSWSSVIGGGENACGTLDLFDATLRFSNLVLLDGSSAQHIEGLKIAASASLDERCLEGGYQDWGTQSKHLTHMHTPALRGFGNVENWQWFVRNDYFCVCDPQLLGSILRKPSSINRWQHGPKGPSLNRQASSLGLNRVTGDSVV